MIQLGQELPGIPCELRIKKLYLLKKCLLISAALKPINQVDTKAALVAH